MSSVSPVQAILDALKDVSRGDPISASQMNLIISALRFALNISGEGVIVDSTGIHIRAVAGRDRRLVLLDGAPRLITGEFARWEYPWWEAMADQSAGNGSKRRLVKNPAGMNSYNAADPYYAPACNMIENGNRAKNGIVTDEIGLIGPGVNADGSSYPAGFAPIAIGPRGVSGAGVAAAVIIERWGIWPDGKPMWLFGTSNANDGTCG